MNKLMLPKLSGERIDGLKFRLPRSTMGRFDAQLRAAEPSKEDRSLYIDVLGSIGDSGWDEACCTAAMVKDQLDSAGGMPVVVTINSPGGDAFEGVAIYNLLRDHPGKVTVRVLGLAASAASVIAMAGDRIEMGEGALLMIHSAWGLVAGNRTELQKFVAVLDELDRSIASLYAKRTGNKYDDVLKMMADETWMAAEDAIEKKFADAMMAPAPKEKAKASAAPVFASTRLTRPAAQGDRPQGVVYLSTSPGASGKQPLKTTLPKGDPNIMNKTTAEQIQLFENKRAASVARMEAIMAAAGEAGSSLDDAQAQEYDTLEGELTTTDAHIRRLKTFEAAMVARAPRVEVQTPAAGTPAAALADRPHSGIISVKANVEKGIPFTRYVRALAMSKGNLPGALAIAQNNRSWMDQTPEVAKVLMTAVAAGDTTSAGWASELVYNENLVAEFIELLRPQTILGKLTGLTRVPFNVRMSGQDSGSSANWVGQGKPVPVSKLHTLEVTLGISKAAGLVVLTQELVRSSAPSAEILVRNDLIKTIATFLDVHFIAPDYAAVANVSPASITNGVAPTAATGTTSAFLRADVQTLFGTWIADNLDPQGGAWVMTPTTALSISLMLNALGQPVFPDITMNGGTFFGLPVIVSNSAKQVGSPVAGEGNLIVLVSQPEILLADDGETTIDASSEASLEMLDNPTNQSVASPVATSQVSMFQTNSVAIRATRFINWKKRRSSAVAYIKDAMYVS